MHYVIIAFIIMILTTSYTGWRTTQRRKGSPKNMFDSFLPPLLVVEVIACMVLLAVQR